MIAPSQSNDFQRTASPPSASFVEKNPLSASPPAAAPSAPARSWLDLAVPVAILLFAAALRLLGLDKSVWFDEASSFVQATGPDFVATARNYDHPPLYFGLLRIGLSITPSFPLLRLFSVACGVAAVAIFCFWPDRRSRRTGWLAALLLAAAPGFVTHSQELRQYALLSFAFAASLACAWRLTQEPRNNAALAGLAAALTLAAATHLLTVFFAFALAAWLLWTFRRSPPRILARLAFAFLPAVLLVVFLKTYFLQATVKTPGIWWMPPVSPELLLRVFRTNTGWDAISQFSYACEHYLHGIRYVVLLASAAAGAFVAWTAFVHRNAGPARSLLAIAGIYWAALIGYSVADAPIVWPRTMLPGMLPCFLAVSLGLSTHPLSRRRIPAIAAASLLAFAMTVPWVRGLAWQPQEDLRGLTSTVRTHAVPAHLLVLVNEVDYSFAPYWPKPNRPAALHVQLRDPFDRVLPTLQAHLGGVLLVYREDLLLVHNRSALDAIRRALAEHRGSPEELWNKDGYHVLRYAARGSP